MLKQTNTRIDSNSRTIRMCVRDTFTKTTQNLKQTKNLKK